MNKRVYLCALALLMIVAAMQAQPVRAQQGSPTPSFNVIYEVKLSSHFSLYGSTTAEIGLVLTGSPPPSNNATHVFVDFSFIFNGIGGLPAGGNYTLMNISQHPVIDQLDITIPPGSGPFDFTVFGIAQETTFAYRSSVTLAYSTISMTAPPYNPQSYQVLVPTSSRFEIVSVFPGTGPGLATQYVTINGTSYLSTGFSYAACFTQACSVQVGFNTVSIIYQPEYFDYFLAAYLLFIVGALIGIGLVFRGRRQAVTGVYEKGKRVVLRILNAVDSKKLLAALVGVGVLMLSLAFAFGPTPTPRVYLAATPSTANALGPYVTGGGFTYLTPTQAGDEFEAMSGLNTYSAVVLADYPPVLQSEGLQSSPRIYLMSSYMNATQVEQYETFYKPTAVVVGSPQQLQIDLTLQARGYSSNHLGLPVSQGVYSTVTDIEAVLSLVIPFLALAFFARYMVESSAKGMMKLAQGAAFSFFVFMFGELIFIQTDVLLTLPVALHATISPLETAGGALGFGGGSRPREVMGILGFLFGGFAGSLKGSKIDRVILIALLSGMAFLLVDPLQLGQDFYNLLLNVLTSQPGTAFGQAAYYDIRLFILFFMNIFGNFVIPTFYSQHGAVIFFAGAVPFALYTYVRRGTATLLLFFSAVVAAVGYVRIGDQDPLKAIASTTPGLAMSIVFILLFLGSDRVERFLRLRLGLG
jgi:hypothetical protein